MSTVYVLEPPTKGKVILKTTYGPLDIELWPKEAPKAVRNFVQLCLEGYYDNTIFHRIIKSYLIQGGDPTGTGTGGESIYGGVFPDEFHSRLRFKHRGLVACAGAGSPNTNGSQFFITLDKCDFLDKKHTIFGKITGDSIYNLLSLGEVETEKDDRPLDPAPKILSVEVLWNPFDDIVPRVTTTRALASSADTDKKDKNQKPKKKLEFAFIW
nr:peptidyl-prolyl cis-trans isomerase CYP57 [Ipomoea batatas]